MLAFGCAAEQLNRVSCQASSSRWSLRCRQLICLCNGVMFVVEDLLLEDLKNYTFLTNGPMAVNGVDDGEMLRETTEAMTIMGMTPEEQAQVFRCVSGVLLMGSMQFKTERNTDQAVLPDNTSMYS